MKYINKVCAVCHTKCEHEIKDSGLKNFPNFVNVKCSKCGFNEMVPKDKVGEEIIIVDEQKFDINNRDVGGDCESGLCPVK